MPRIVRHAAVLLVLIVSLPAHALTLSGRVLAENGDALAGATIRVNDTVTNAGDDGRFTATVAEKDLYTLRYESVGHYPAVHAFSPLELAWSSADGVGKVPDVTLVARKPGRVLLAFGGDAMMGRRYSEPYPNDPVLIREEHRAGDTKALLQHMKPYLEAADFASVNLETQVMDQQPEANAPKSYVFFTPPEAVVALRDAGVDYVTLGNNHTNDYLAEGLVSTLDALRAANMPFSGAGLDEADALEAYRSQIGGQAYSFLGYVGWAGNFTPNQVAMGADKSGAAFGTAENLRRTVTREARAGYLPVVQYHGSREYTDEPTLVTETRLKRAIDQGAALAIAHHPHVVQGFEIYDGRLIAYSMGNFIFDQFHYSTRFSYLAYVWMDGDRLHRAEVMPIHIQGYTPMPATDTVRRKVLQRTYALSARRGIRMGRSGGNGVIHPGGGPANGNPAFHPDGYGSSIEPMHGRNWNEPVESIEASEGVRLGMDLLPMGHLENHFLHGSPDRSWIEDGMQTVERDGLGNHHMRLAIPAGAGSGRVGMRTFDNSFEPGTPSTFTARVLVDAPATVTAYQQWRGRNDRDRFEALANNRLRVIGKVELEPGGWRDLRFDFDSPRVSAVSYRVVLRVEPEDPSRAHESRFDDFNLIEWLTPPLGAGELPGHLEVGQASHAEVATP